jgi:autotransporter-associated beta strand protein
VADGGTVSLKGKQVKNTGTVSANGGTAGVTNGVVTDASVTGKGGTVTLLGDQVGLFDGSFVSAVGMTGGGTVLVGGDWQGGNGVPQARQVVMVTDSRIDASALNTGNGGKVVLWSTESTDFYGSIKATGGTQSGDGGRVETSSHGILQAMGTLDLAAPNGKGGEWLLDPKDLQVTSGTEGNFTLSGGNFTMTDPTTLSQVSDGRINTLLNSGTSVSLTATSWLIINSDAIINKTTANGASLTLTGGHGFRIFGNIASSQSLPVFINTELWIAGAGNINTGGGTLTINVSGISFGPSGSGWDWGYDGVISGSGDVEIKGGGTLAFLGNNTYTGKTTISDSGTNLIVGGNYSTYANTGTIGTGDVILNDPNAQFKYQRSGNSTLANNFSGTGGIVIGDGTSAPTVTLTGNNTYSGTTWVNSGTLKAGSAGAFSANSKYSFNTNGTTAGILDLGTNSQSIGMLDGSSNGQVKLGANTLTLTGQASSAAADRTFGGVISGTGSLIVTGTGGNSQILSGTNTFTGGVTVSGGTLVIAGKPEPYHCG